MKSNVVLFGCALALLATTLGNLQPCRARIPAAFNRQISGLSDLVLNGLPGTLPSSSQLADQPSADPQLAQQGDSTQQGGGQQTAAEVDAADSPPSDEDSSTDASAAEQAGPPDTASGPSAPGLVPHADGEKESSDSDSASSPIDIAELAQGDGQTGAVSGASNETIPADSNSVLDSPLDVADQNGTAIEAEPANAELQPANAELATDPATPRLTQSWLNLRTNILLGVVLACLAIASIVGQYLTRQPTESVNPALVRRFRQRLNAWWLMCAILVFGLLLQPTGTVVLFGLVSFWALREFITMAPTRRGDHRGLFWALVAFTPLQYVLIGLERSGIQWRDGRTVDFYELYSIMIPVYAALYIPARIAMAGDHKKFLERSAQITFGLLICVYALSYAAALINLRLAYSDGTPWNGSPAGLLFFFILVAQLSDILQWTWGQLIGKRIIAPEISSGRTWEGFAGGTLSTGLIGAALFWVTPFSFWEAACMSMVIGVMGMFGGMTMSAIKRDRGVSDYGSLVLGHAGVLDRIDSLCFAAPVFYHLTRFFFSQSS